MTSRTLALWCLCLLSVLNSSFKNSDFFGTIQKPCWGLMYVLGYKVIVFGERVGTTGVASS